MMIKPDEEILLGAGKRFRVVAVRFQRRGSVGRIAL